MLEKFNIHKPIIQAPMAGATTPKLVSACCEAGILGSIGAGYLNGEETRAFIQEVKRATNKPFAVNLFIQEQPQIDTNVLQQARMALQPIYEQLNIPAVQTVVSDELYAGQLQAVIEEQVPICSFTFGIPTASDIQRLKEAGIYTIGTATTLQEALAVEAAGLDAVVAQGKEAGGHRGSFIEPIELIPQRELLRQIIDNVTIPVIAAGGIMTAEHVQEALQAGAAAVQLGTVFLVATESEISPVHKEAILQSKESSTTLTKAFTGKIARGLANEFTEQLKEAAVAPYPLQHHLTVSIRKESAKQKRPEFLSLWMGENSFMATEAPIANIVETMLKNID